MLAGWTGEAGLEAGRNEASRASVRTQGGGTGGGWDRRGVGRDTGYAQGSEVSRSAAKRPARGRASTCGRVRASKGERAKRQAGARAKRTETG